MSSETPFTWQYAEHLAAAHLRSLGYQDAEVTAAGSDGGIDVRGEHVVAQVKHYLTGPVGSPAVQQLHGAALGAKAVFYARGGFTANAIAYADQADVALLGYDDESDVTAANPAGERLLSTPHVAIDHQILSIARRAMVDNLREFGQESIDSLTLVLDLANARLQSILDEARSSGELTDDARQVAVGIADVIPDLLSTLEDLRDDSPRPVSNAMNAIVHAESYGQHLAALIGADFDSVARAAQEAHANGSWEDEGRRVDFTDHYLQRMDAD